MYVCRFRHTHMHTQDKGEHCMSFSFLRNLPSEFASATIAIRKLQSKTWPWRPKIRDYYVESKKYYVEANLLSL